MIFSILLSFTMAMTPAQDDNISAITNAISSGNADALGKHFDTQVEVAVKDTESTYSKSEAINTVHPRSFAQSPQFAAWIP